LRLNRVQSLAALNSRFLTLLFDGRSEHAQRQLSMIPCGDRFFDPRLAVGEQACKKQRGLNLRASHLHLVINRLQAPTGNLQGRTAAVSGEPVSTLLVPPELETVFKPFNVIAKHLTRIR
jgi:hypothetical protein